MIQGPVWDCGELTEGPVDHWSMELRSQLAPVVPQQQRQQAAFAHLRPHYLHPQWWSQ